MLKLFQTGRSHMAVLLQPEVTEAGAEGGDMEGSGDYYGEDGEAELPGSSGEEGWGGHGRDGEGGDDSNGSGGSSSHGKQGGGAGGAKGAREGTKGRGKSQETVKAPGPGAGGGAGGDGDSSPLLPGQADSNMQQTLVHPPAQRCVACSLFPPPYRHCYRCGCGGDSHAGAGAGMLCHSQHTSHTWCAVRCRYNALHHPRT